LGVSRHSVNELFNDRRSVTPLMALKLAYVLDTDPDFWLNVQKAYDLFQARDEFESERSNLKVVRKGSLDRDPSLKRAAG
jgi:plasmid maintenance system antidote protein VapI